MSNQNYPPLSETQRKVNELMGISTADYFKHNNSQPMANSAGSATMDHMTMSGAISIPLIDALQTKINKALGIGEGGRMLRQPVITDAQLEVNKQMGISEETFLKYNK